MLITAFALVAPLIAGPTRRRTGCWVLAPRCWPQAVGPMRSCSSGIWPRWPWCFRGAFPFTGRMPTVLVLTLIFGFAIAAVSYALVESPCREALRAGEAAAEEAPYRSASSRTRLHLTRPADTWLST